MKKIVIYSLLFLLLSSFTGGLAFAQSGEGEVTLEDLGAGELGLLPTNPFYFLKEWRRSVQSFFTLNPAAKIELELDIANQKAAELKQIQINQPDDIRSISAAIQNYKEAQERLRDKFEALKETSENPNIDLLLDKFADRVIQHEKLLMEVAEELDDQDIEKLVKETAQKIEEAAAKAMARDNSAKFISRLEKSLVESKGGELKHVRSLEILDRLEKEVSDEAKDSLERLREDFSIRLEKDIEELLNKAEREIVAGLLKESPGDSAQRLRNLEEVKLLAGKRVADFLTGVNKDLEKIVAEDKYIAEKAKEQIERAEEMIQEAQKRLSESSGVSKDLLKKAQGNLDLAKASFKEGKYGEAFGQARTAEVLARNVLKELKAGEPQAENLKEILGELAEKIGKYSRLMAERGYTQDQHPKLFELLAKAREHYALAKEALVKNNDLEAAKLHIGHVRGFLSDLARLLESEFRLQEAVKPAPATAASDSLNRCEILKADLSKLDQLLKGGAISEAAYKLKFEAIKKQLEIVCENALPSEIRPVSLPTVESEREVICTLEYNPVCGVNGKTYSNACFMKADRVEIKYKGVCGAVKIESREGSIEPIAPAEIKVSSEAIIAEPATAEFKIEADDKGFYPEAILFVKKGARVKIHFIVRTDNVYYGGLDFRSSKFKTESVKPGGSVDVEFIADESLGFSSYWPASGVLKASGKIVVQ
ncbi:MAG: DUF5667 domain-containing protein [bacterium]|nr:DUF5667 domain-containing protein [bacterium]